MFFDVVGMRFYWTSLQRFRQLQIFQMRYRDTGEDDWSAGDTIEVKQWTATAQDDANLLQQHSRQRCKQPFIMNSQFQAQALSIISNSSSYPFSAFSRRKYTHFSVPAGNLNVHGCDEWELKRWSWFGGLWGFFTFFTKIKAGKGPALLTSLSLLE